MGPFRPPFSEIEAYSRVMDCIILPWEAYAIRRLAEEYMIWDDKRDKSKATQPLKNVVDMDDAKGMTDFWRRIAARPEPNKEPAKAKTKRS